MLQRRLENSTALKSGKGRIAVRPKMSAIVNKIILEILLRKKIFRKNKLGYFYKVTEAGKLKDCTQ